MKLDGSIDVQIVCTINTTCKSKLGQTIWIKAPIQNEIGLVEGCVKHLSLNQEGHLLLHINGFGVLKGKSILTDGIDHVVAVRHTMKDLKWAIIVDGNEEASMQIVQKTPPPAKSAFRLGIKVLNK